MTTAVLIEVRVPDRSTLWEKLKDRVPKAGDERWVFRIALKHGCTDASFQLWTWHRYVIGPKGTVVLSEAERWEHGTHALRDRPKVPMAVVLAARSKLIRRVEASVDRGIALFGVFTATDAPEGSP